MKVLIIDDNKADLDLLKLYISELNTQCEVITADTGEEGIMIAEAEKPDIVVIDTVLTGIDGFETCSKIKQIKGLDVKVIIATGFVDAVDAGRAREYGADTYAVKTHDCAQILEALKQHIKGS